MCEWRHDCESNLEKECEIALLCKNGFHKVAFTCE